MRDMIARFKAHSIIWGQSNSCGVVLYVKVDKKRVLHFINELHMFGYSHNCDLNKLIYRHFR